ncbi:MAG: hypothetical protein HGA86_01440, partial [Anaerolineaceae bacterium]|nr:hypothetical protein [Anaerolineaceae bacterium]
MVRKKTTPPQKITDPLEILEKARASTNRPGRKATPGSVVPASKINPADAPGAEDDLISKDEVEEPAILPVSEEWSDLVLEDPLEILEDPVIAVELSEDPVRLYLKEIGQINLLDADSEFRLAACIEAERYIDILSQHLEAQPGNKNFYKELFSKICEDLILFWERF